MEIKVCRIRRKSILWFHLLCLVNLKYARSGQSFLEFFNFVEKILASKQRKTLLCSTSLGDISIWNMIFRVCTGFSCSQTYEWKSQQQIRYSWKPNCSLSISLGKGRDNPPYKGGSWISWRHSPVPALPVIVADSLTRCYGYIYTSGV